MMKRPEKFMAKKSAPVGSRVGLARALSKMGYCSRRVAFELVRAGRVRLNGSTPRNPETPVRLQIDRIEVDDKRVGETEKLYWMLNKTAGAITTADDEQNRTTVYAALPKNLPWMGPVGRLDKASEGLLLFTNDSEWGAKITDPASHLDKTYHVQLNVIASDALLAQLLVGISGVDGILLRAKSARLLRAGEKHSWIEIVLDEGKNRQIRRMLDARGVEILRLIRVAVGPLELGALAKGASRSLTAREKDLLDRALRRCEIQGRTSAATGKHQ